MALGSQKKKKHTQTHKHGAHLGFPFHINCLPLPRERLHSRRFMGWILIDWRDTTACGWDPVRTPSHPFFYYSFLKSATCHELVFLGFFFFLVQASLTWGTSYALLCLVIFLSYSTMSGYEEYISQATLLTGCAFPHNSLDEVNPLLPPDNKRATTRNNHSWQVFSHWAPRVKRILVWLFISVSQRHDSGRSYQLHFWVPDS